MYKARDTRLNRTVAIKILPSADPELRGRFEREARTIASLQHPHICTLFDVGQDGDAAYLVLEYLDGETLAERLSRGPLPRAEAIRIATEIADALDRAQDNHSGTLVPLGVVAAARGRDAEAIEWFRRMSAAGGRGAWLSQHCLADLEVARGRTNDAERRLVDRLAEDIGAKNTEAVARGYAFLAEIAASAGRASDASRYAASGLRVSAEPEFAYRFALSLMDVGRTAEARRLVERMRGDKTPRAAQFATALDSELVRDDPARRARILENARTIGTWWAYYRAAIVLSRERAPEAAEALAWCKTHESQGWSAYLDDVPTIRYVMTLRQLAAP